MRMFRLLVAAFVVVALTGAAVHAEPKRVKLGTMAPEGSPWMKSLEAMSAKLLEASGGAYKWQIFPGGQLGDEIQMAESTQYGSIECAGISTGALANLLPSLQVFELPFFWDSREQAYYVIDNQFREYFSEEVQKIGLELLGWSENGWRHFFTKTDKKIRKPSDLKGLRMRSQESPVHISFWKALNVNPIPLATTEIYQALERGIIDGGDNIMVLIAAAGWIEVIESVTLSGHIYQPAVLACNKDWWDTVEEAQKKIFYDAMREAETDMRERLLKTEKELAGTFRDMGKDVIELSDQELERFRKLGEQVAQDSQIRKMIGAEVLELAEAGKREFAKKQNK